MTIPILLSTRSSRLMNSQEAIASNRTGKTFYPTTSSTMVKKSPPCSGVLHVIYRKTAPVWPVMLRFFIFPGVTERRSRRFGTRSARPISHPLRITDFPKLPNCAVTSVPTSLFLKRTVNTSSYINVSMTSALTTFTTLKNLNEDYAKNKYKLHISTGNS